MGASSAPGGRRHSSRAARDADVQAIELGTVGQSAREIDPCVLVDEPHSLRRLCTRKDHWDDWKCNALLLQFDLPFEGHSDLELLRGTYVVRPDQDGYGGGVFQSLLELATPWNARTQLAVVERIEAHLGEMLADLTHELDVGQ